jgi:hypothetical protein
MLDEQTTNLETAAPEASATVERLFTDEQFAHLGGGTLCYVKPMLSQDVQKVFPNAPSIDPGLKIFALLGADGHPLILSDSREMAVANAREANLELVSLH